MVDTNIETAELMAQLEQLKAENAALKAKPVRKLGIKVGAKGGVSIYGIGRFPVTLYAEQWKRLLDAKEAISTFIQEHGAELAVKG
jgi:hypothetical protein